MIVVIFYPILEGVLMSFHKGSFLRPDTRTFVGLGNFRTLVQNSTVWTALWNSAVLTGVSVALQFVRGPGLALLLKQKVPGILILRSITMIPWAHSVIVMVIIFN